MCDGVSLSAIAREVGTPVYVYSAKSITEAYRGFARAFDGYPSAIHYALKAQSTLGILRLLRALGSGADANSGGEVEVALRAGFLPDAIVFSGVGKSDDELGRAIALGLKSLNVESPGELRRVEQTASGLGVRARVALRVNPDIDPETHPHISTGLGSTKFGMPPGDAAALLRTLVDHPWVDPVGIHVHVGSQIASLAPLVRAAGAAAALARDARAAGARLEYLDLGGGLGISYNGQPVPTIAEYAAAILPIVKDAGLSLVVEPGRAMVGPAGVLVTRVIDVKQNAPSRQFVVVDAGMTELLRPALYGAYHRIEPAAEPGGDQPVAVCDVVGPVCETTDTLAAARSLPSPRVGDLLVIRDAGAYGFVMASNYNRRPLPPEVLVESGAWRIIRRRQTIDDQLALEQ